MKIVKDLFKVNQGGFTLVEIVFSITVIIIITGSVVFGFREGSSSSALKRGVAKVGLELRQAQSAALNTNLIAGEAPFGYGIYFDTDLPDQIVLFADLPDPGIPGDQGNKLYNFGNELIEVIDLEKGVNISSLNPLALGNSLTIFFRSPEPKTYINGFNSGSAAITLNLERDPGKARVILINISGQIDIQ
jgi:type II secretory pathway pseudopilin PulG